jgi:hypothetical protein
MTNKRETLKRSVEYMKHVRAVLDSSPMQNSTDEEGKGMLTFAEWQLNIAISSLENLLASLDSPANDIPF